MKNKAQLDGMPVWFDGKSINEALFCEEFLQTHKIIFTNGAFFTPEGRVTDELPLRGEIFEELKCCAVSNIPRWMNNPTYRQLMAGNFLDILFDCPYEMHNLTADAFISRMVEELSEEHKEVLYFLSLRLYSSTRLAAMRGQSARNIRKLRKTIHKKLQRQMYDHLCGKQEHGGSLTLRERHFLEEYSKIAKKQGKDAVIRRENKTKRRKKKNRP